MKKLFIYIIILYTISGFSQKKYNVDIIEEKHKYYKDESSFKKLIQNFTKGEFNEIFKTSIIDNDKIDGQKLEFLRNEILKNIPNDSISHIWVVYGYKNKQFYSKYSLSKYLINKKDLFFMQLNYHLNKNNKIDSISVYIPKKKCNKILKYRQRQSSSELFQSQKILNNNIILDTEYNLKKQKEFEDKEKASNKAIWFLN